MNGCRRLSYLHHEGTPTHDLTTDQGSRSDGRLGRDTISKEEKHLGTHGMCTTTLLSYSTSANPRLDSKSFIVVVSNRREDLIA